MSGTAPRCVVVAGVSGSGKTTIARAVADALDWSFAEGDDLHPAANTAKMAAGLPLSDEDRAPWLAAVGRRIDQNGSGAGLVITCSALRRAYRDELRQGRPGVLFCQVDAPRDVLEERLRRRRGHFMPASLLDSQLATLEPLQPDEPGFVVDSARPVASVVGEVTRRLGLREPDPDLPGRGASDGCAGGGA